MFGKFQPSGAAPCAGSAAVIGLKIGLKKACAYTTMLLLLSLSARASRLVVDDLGRSVSVPDHAHRVICLTPSITDTVYAIGGGEDIAGITEYTHYPPQAAGQKPSIGDLLHPSLEKIAALHPDLAIAVATLNSAETVQAIERIGIPIFLVTDRGLAGLYQSISSIGLAMGYEREAASGRRATAGARAPSAFAGGTRRTRTFGFPGALARSLHYGGARSVYHRIDFRGRGAPDYPRSGSGLAAGKPGGHDCQEAGLRAAAARLAIWARRNAAKSRMEFARCGSSGARASYRRSLAISQSGGVRRAGGFRSSNPGASGKFRESAWNTITIEIVTIKIKDRTGECAGRWANSLLRQDARGSRLQPERQRVS